MNTRFVFVIALAVASGSADARSQRPSDDTTFVLHINQSVDRAMIGASYCVRGVRTDDGYCAAEIPGPFLTMLGPQDIAISTKLPHGGRGTALQAVVYCRGYKLALIDIPSLEAETSRRRTIVLEPLGTVPLAGRVVLPDEKDLTELTLVVEYDLHQFAEAYLHRMGGPISLTGFQASTARLKADGTFTVTIPDFLGDPSVARAANQGLLYFSVRTPRFVRGAVESYNLRVVGGSPAWPGAWRIGLLVASSYDNSVTLERDDKADGAGRRSDDRLPRRETAVLKR